MILIVDDHDDTRRVLLRLLNLDGYDVIDAPNGKDALIYLQTHIPQLIILDYGLPDMDGIDIFHALRQDPRLTHVPVIIFSAYEGPQKEKALKAGVDAYVVKTALDWARLQQEIQRLAGPATRPASHPSTPQNKKDRTA